MTLLWAGLALVGAALLVAALRFVLGPSALDRMVSLDAIVAVIMSGLMIHAAMTGDSTVLPAVVAVSLVGFLGSSTVARFLGRGRGPGPRPAARDGAREDTRNGTEERR
ncbi:monovalent cation/H+ antiporter complex subunit F [Actinomycetospora sp. CA-084318]|uniref:monovalent cation/H+ antiporter complex subunit F n=1 Tax=Actinomycetospora sp. CA-084318 TaxID=3239892 RepID=UPI003D95FB35